MTSAAGGLGVSWRGVANFIRSTPGAAVVKVALTANDPAEVLLRKFVANPL